LANGTTSDATIRIDNPLESSIVAGGITTASAESGPDATAGGALRTRGEACLRGAAGLRTAGAFAAGAFAAGALAAFAGTGTGAAEGGASAGTPASDTGGGAKGAAGLRVRVIFGANCFGLTTTGSISAGTGEAGVSAWTTVGGALSGTDGGFGSRGASASAAVAGGAAVGDAAERVLSRGFSDGSAPGGGVDVERGFDEPDLPLAMMIAVIHGVAHGHGGQV
jgi:hypothetical protein